jgi:ferritin-like metal-binding protein YciE
MLLKTQHASFVEGLKNLYSAQNQLLRLLPRMAKIAAHPELRKEITDELHQAQVHLHRLDGIFLRLGLGPKGNTDVDMERLAEKAKRMMSENAQANEMDADLMAWLKNIQQLATPAYASVQSAAQQLGHANAARTLQESLDENIETDGRLKTLSKSSTAAASPRSNGTVQ